MPEFECDEKKSASNLTKHGSDFFTAQALWLDPDLLEVCAKTPDEPGFLIVGLIQHKHRSTVVAYRGGRIRLISVRRSRQEEIRLYES